jgi:hypothetical protein
MTTTTLTKTPRTLIAAATSNAAGATTEGTPLSLMGKHGGILTGKITNGATGPTLQATIQVFIAHNATTPGAGGEGADWKLIYELPGGVAANAISRIKGYPIDAAAMQLHGRCTGNTGQAVTCELYFSEITDAQSA